ESRRNVAEQDVSRDPTAESAEQGHAEDADRGEVLVVIRTAGQQRAVESVRGRGDQVHRRVVARELPSGEPADRRSENEVRCHPGLPLVDGRRPGSTDNSTPPRCTIEAAGGAIIWPPPERQAPRRPRETGQQLSFSRTACRVPA